MKHFQDVISDCALHDMDYSGPKFTWWNHQDANPIGKKLDRVLINANWLDVFPTAHTDFQASGFSDHARALVCLDTERLIKRKPFRFFNHLTQTPQFLEIVADFWNRSPPLYHSRCALLLLHKRLKLLKPLFRRLNRERYGSITIKTQEAFDVLCAKQKEALTNPTEENFRAEKEASHLWNHLAKVEEEFYRQKSRITWLDAGDLNTTFFHNTVKSRHSRNAITTITSRSDDILTSPLDIAAEAVSYFEDLLSPSPIVSTGPLLTAANIVSFHCTLDDAQALVAPFTAEDIRKVVFSLPLNKAPGPDGFTAEFFRSTWTMLGQDVVTAIQSFFAYGSLPRGLNATILALIPKVTPPITMRDFRPISCCNTIYKIISRLLADRLQSLMPLIVEPNQCAFIQGRLLSENVLLATELTKNYHKSTITARGALKLDISKAFDSITWDFILEVLQAMDVPILFIHWIRACITSAAFSISVNGNLEGFFTSTRGIRQGCSLSPYLFNLVMNILSLLLNKAATKGYIGYHPMCKEIGLTHLSFADDLMVFFDGSTRSLNGIMDILHIFGAASGLKINHAKSTLFHAGRIDPMLLTRAASLGIPIHNLPIRYLGLPLTTKIMTRTDYEPLIDQIRNRLLSWTNRFLSYGGRIQLIKSVIASITNFWQSVFPLPQGCLDTIESLCASFLWSGNIDGATGAKVSWKDVCLPLSEGGLGMRRFEDTGLVFSLHLIWRVLTTPNSLWVSWVQRYLLRGSSFWDPQIKLNGSWVWRKLLHLRPLAAPFFKVDIRSGQQAYFWHDNWLSNNQLLQHNDRLTLLLGVPRNARVSDACNAHQWTLRQPRTGTSKQLYDAVMAHSIPRPDDGDDVFLWRMEEDVFKPRFSSSHTWRQIRTPTTTAPWWRVVWFPLAIPRQSFILWLAFRNRLSTGSRMRAWGVTQPCTFCGERNESREHLFFGCPYTFQVWVLLARNLLPRSINPGWLITITSIQSPRRSKLDSLLLRLAFQTAIYAVWRERNSRIHNAIAQPFTSLARSAARLIRDKIISYSNHDSDLADQLRTRWDAVWDQRRTSLQF